MRGHECYHCKQWIDEGVEHDCWTTTEAALTRDLSDDLRDAWERLRETAADFGEQRIYASHKSIMFSRRACYFFVRPRRRDLEVTFFVGRLLKSGRIRRSDRPRNARSPMSCSSRIATRSTRRSPTGCRKPTSSPGRRRRRQEAGRRRRQPRRRLQPQGREEQERQQQGREEDSSAELKLRPTGGSAGDRYGFVNARRADSAIGQPMKTMCTRMPVTTTTAAPAGRGPICDSGITT